MPGIVDSEKMNSLVKEIMSHKIANDLPTATKVAENLMAGESRLSEGEKYFKQVIFNKVTDDLVKWFAGDKLESEIKRLENEIQGLRNELAEVRKIAVQAAERKTVKKVIEVEEDAETGEVIKKQPVEQEKKPEEKPKTSSVGAGQSRQDMDPNQYDISKIFYTGGKKF